MPVQTACGGVLGGDIYIYRTDCGDVDTMNSTYDKRVEVTFLVCDCFLIWSTKPLPLSSSMAFSDSSAQDQSSSVCLHGSQSFYPLLGVEDLDDDLGEETRSCRRICREKETFEHRVVPYSYLSIAQLS